MTSSNELLKRLLAGDFTPEEIADDPVLVNLADRIYGIKIAPVTPVKPRNVEGQEAVPVTEVAPPTDMLIEVIGDIAPAAPLPELQLPAAPEPVPVVAEKKSKLGVRLIVAGLGFVILNLFGAWSALFGSLCRTGDLCPSDGYTRINLMDIYQVNTGYGWSEPVQSGAFGIPDVVAISVLLVALLVSVRR